LNKLDILIVYYIRLLNGNGQPDIIDKVKKGEAGGTLLPNKIRISSMGESDTNHPIIYKISQETFNGLFR